MALVTDFEYALLSRVDRIAQTLRRQRPRGRALRLALIASIEDVLELEDERVRVLVPILDEMWGPGELDRLTDPL